MTLNQIKNLFGFSFLFLNESNGFYGIAQHSPDYIMEKYKTFINIPVKQWKNGYSNQFQIFLRDVYYRRWGSNEVKLPDDTECVIQYLYVISRIWIKKGAIKPNDMIKNFNIYVGNIDTICDSPLSVNTLHVIFRTNLLEKYIEKNARVIKLLTLE